MKRTADQPTLFDVGPPKQRDFGDVRPVARAARNDPATSHEAAERMMDSGALARQTATVLDVLLHFGPGTSEELSDRSGVKYEAIARRMPDLVRTGRAEECGKKRNSRGFSATIWRLKK